MHLLKKAMNPAFWQKVQTADCFCRYRKEMLELYQTYADTDAIPDLKYSEYKLYWVTGNRSTYEDHYFGRRLALASAALLALIYPDEEKYLLKVSDLLFCVCNEYSWCLPAHQGDLNTVNSTRIDLFAAVTGFTLAEIYTLLEPRLDPLIKNRILYEIDRRIFTPFLATEPYGEAFWESAPHNWAAVCMGSVACTMMLLHPDTARKNLSRFEHTMTTYLSGLSDDGICSEGVAYWHYGFGFFTVYADMVRMFTNGEIDWFQNDKVKLVATFMQKMYLSGTATVSYADGSRSNRYLLGLLHRLKDEYPDDILVYPPEYSYIYDHCGRFCLILRCATWLSEETYAHPAPIDAQMTYYAPKLQWLVCKRANYGFSAKGGSNAELHNHNDVGSFIFAKNGVQCLCDIGCGAYTRQYFDSKLRYTILECSSRSHSVPIIGGTEQIVGSAAHTKDVTYEDGLLTMEFSAAYPVSGLEKLQRTFRCEDDKVILEDSLLYHGTGKIIDRLVSLFEPVPLNNHTLKIGAATVTYDPDVCDYALHTEPTTSTGQLCYLMDFTLKMGVTTITFVME